MKFPETSTSRFGAVAAAALFAVGGIGAANAALGPPEKENGGITIDLAGEVTMNGTGCPPGTASVDVMEDTVAVSYSAYQVQAGTSAADRTKSCTMNIPVKVPAGYSVTPTSVTYRGTSEGLGESVKGFQQAKYWFAGSSITSAAQARELIPEGEFGDWAETDEFPTEAVNTICDGAPTTIRVTSAIKITGKPAKGVQAFVSQDTADMKLGEGPDKRGMLIAFDLKPCG